MKFSIVITTYNRLSFLKRAIDSAVNQTVPCEVVVADDGSTDGTEQYVCSLGDRVTYQRNRENLGHAQTMNAGVKRAKGEWIKPLDDDDYLAPNCIAEMERAIALHPEAVICSCQAAQVNLHEKEISHTRSIGIGKTCYIPQADIHYGMLLEFLPFGTPAQVAFRRDAFCQTRGWDSRLDTNCDDIDSWIEIARFGDAIFLNQCLAYRTIWPDAYNAKIPLKTRLNTNIIIKEKIYQYLSDRHRRDIPSLDSIRAYLHLHWSLVALKRRQIRPAVQLFYPSCLSWVAWQLLVQAIIARKGKKTTAVRFIPLEPEKV